MTTPLRRRALLGLKGFKAGGGAVGVVAKEQDVGIIGDVGLEIDGERRVASDRDFEGVVLRAVTADGERAGNSRVK